MTEDERQSWARVEAERVTREECVGHRMLVNPFDAYLRGVGPDFDEILIRLVTELREELLETRRTADAAAEEAVEATRERVGEEREKILSRLQETYDNCEPLKPVVEALLREDGRNV